MNLSEKMDDLIARLRKDGFQGIKFPEIRASCREHWTADYATAHPVYADTFLIEDAWEGFDPDQYYCDFERFLQEFFGDTIQVHYRRGCQEIEVYPKKNDAPIVVEVEGPIPALRGNEKRIVPNSELAKSSDYCDMAELARMFRHDVIETQEGVFRWRSNPLVRWLLDDGNPNAVSLNNLWVDFHNGRCGTVLEMMKFYMSIGYSLCGFAEIFGQVEAEEWKLPGALKPSGGDEYTETPIGYVLRVHKDKFIRV